MLCGHSVYAQNDSIPKNVPDSTLSQSDTNKVEEQTSSSSFNSKVEYLATDSLRFDVKKQLVYLYGSGEVYYETTSLKADYVELDLNSNEVFSRGTLDTNSGELVGKPEFSDGGQEFEATEMRYNFQSKKGLISDAVTQQGDGYVTGDKVKKLPDDVIYIADGRFCPCEDRDAKTFIQAKKIKIIPDDKVVTGPANLKLGNIPTPLILPFGIFPNRRGAASGIIPPQFNYSESQGFSLQQGGYYWAVNDYMDLSFLGDIYSRGSWGLGLKSNYNVKYRFRGNVDLKYSRFVEGSAETQDLRRETIYRIFWKHVQDPKSSPYSNFSADVNVYANNRLDITSTSQQYLSNTFKSNINYNYKFPNSPFRLTVNASHELNSIDTNTYAQLVLPQLTLNMDRIYPFKRKYKVGRDKWYEKIGLTYSSTALNKINTLQDSLFTESALDDLKYGIRHSFGLNTNYKLLKVFSFQPSFNYRETWEFKQTTQNWDADSGVVNDHTIEKFGRYGTWDAGATVSTKMYMFYNFLSFLPVKTIRHVITPQVGFRVTPNYSDRDYVQQVQVDTLGNLSTYSIYDDYSPFSGAPTNKETGKITMELQNNFEMKVRSRKDTLTGYKKVKLLDQLRFSTDYDLFADSMNWNNLSIVASTNLFNFFRINYNSSMDFYAYGTDSSDNNYRLNTFELTENGRLGRFVRHAIGINFTLSNKKQQERKKKKLEEMNKSAFVFQNIPWSISVGYTYNYQKPYDDDSKQQTQALVVNTKMQITQNWQFDASLNFDLEAREFGYTTFSIYRDMNCWEARIMVVPAGGQQQYNFGINLKPSMFKDLKIERKRNFYDFN